MNIAAHMQAAAEDSPDRPAIALGARVLLRYGELADRVSRLAHALRHQYKLLKGERVALVMKNSPEYLETLYACWHAGLIAIPINAKLHRNEFAYILEDSGARLCFVTPDVVDTISPLLVDPLQTIIDVSTDEYASMLSEEQLTLCSVDPEDAAWLFY
ncbi:MAG: long-chain acyl-CoA synthetase, partial [Gammaproteobacteria bacterium]